VVANQDLVRLHVNLEKIKNMIDLFEEILDA